MEDFFNRFSANLALYVTEPSDVFLCPVCHRAFPRNAIPWGHMDRAHIVPASLGGKEYTIICKECNNTIGSNIEGKAIAGDRFFRPITDGGLSTRRSPVSIYLDNNEVIKTSVILVSEEGTMGRGLNILFDVDRMNPQAVDKLKTHLTNGNSLNISFSEPPSYSRIVGIKLDVSVAFLAIFNLMGYEFALSPVGLYFRSLLNDPQQEAKLTHFTTTSNKQVPIGMVFLVDSSPASFAVSMPSCKPFPDGRFLWIPPLFDDEAIFSNLIQGNTAKAFVKPLVPIDLTSVSARSFFHQNLYGKQWSLHNVDSE